MFVKGIALTALVASTPLAFFATQDPVRQQKPEPAAAARPGETRNHEAELQQRDATVKRVRAELKAAQDDLKHLRAQLDAALDRLDLSFEPQRDRNCSPSRNRAMMSHYQWLRDQGHQQRAGVALAKVVDQVGDNVSRLNGAAWDLMTDKETAGQFDEVALALVQRMEQNRDAMGQNQLDTAALAHFLNGNVDQAIELQQLAIEKGGSNDDFRRRLRTYEAARSALSKAQKSVGLPAATMIASNEDEE